VGNQHFVRMWHSSLPSLSQHSSWLTRHLVPCLYKIDRVNGEKSQSPTELEVPLPKFNRGPVNTHYTMADFPQNREDHFQRNAFPAVSVPWGVPAPSVLQRSLSPHPSLAHHHADIRQNAVVSDCNHDTLPFIGTYLPPYFFRDCRLILPP
jgi:hypothetical protein